MSDTNTFGPAFPGRRYNHKTMLFEDFVGISTRDYFAAKAIEGHLCEGGWRCDQSHFDDVAKGAYRFADAMLKARQS